MALQKTITLTSGIVVTDAYHRIERLEVKIAGAVVTAVAQISSYLDGPSCLTRASVKQNSYPIPDFDKGAMGAAQVYDYLKTHADFAGAIDV